MLENDNVYVVVSSDQLNQILKAFGHNEEVLKMYLYWWWEYWVKLS